MTQGKREIDAFHVARADTKPEKRKLALDQVSRPGLLKRLINESKFPDTRRNALKKFVSGDPGRRKRDDWAFLLDLAMNDADPEIRATAFKNVDPADRNKLASCNYPEIRRLVAQMTSSRDILMRLLIDPNPDVQLMAEKGLGKRGLEQPHPLSIN